MRKLLLFDFSKVEDWTGWKTENDGIQGGNSISNLESSGGGNGIFRGSISLENGSGFASLHHQFDTKEIEDYRKASILLKGDGLIYQFRIKARAEDKVSYSYTFQTTGTWQIVEVPLKEMEPVVSREEPALPNFGADTIEEIQFFIGNNKQEDFRLEINKIELN